MTIFYDERFVPNNPRIDEESILKLTLVSAIEVANVRRLGRMKVYAEVSLNGEYVKTGVDMKGGTNPRWDFSHNFLIKDSSLKEPGLCMVVKLYTRRTLGDRFIFEVKICIKTLFDSWSSSHSHQYVAKTNSGKLNINFSFE